MKAAVITMASANQRRRSGAEGLCGAVSRVSVEVMARN
jgi:hypothetical protein